MLVHCNRHILGGDFLPVTADPNVTLCDSKDENLFFQEEFHPHVIFLVTS